MTFWLLQFVCWYTLHEVKRPIMGPKKINEKESRPFIKEDLQKKNGTGSITEKKNK